MLFNKILETLKSKIDIRDAHCYGGTLLLAMGGYFVYQPLGLIIPGAVLLYIALKKGA